MGTIIYQVDAFTDVPFRGNPAAVCILDGPAEDRWMQQVAREMNLSETAFLYPENEGFRLRWFTPAVEVELCGHATLASSHILWETERLPRSQDAVFYTLSGQLGASWRSGVVELDFPATRAEATDPPVGLCDALQVAPAFVGKSRFDYLVEVDSEATVRELDPDHSALKKLPVRGIMVTAPAESVEFDFVSRFFAPGAGIDEDPVTGSAHCCLGPYWSEKLGKETMNAFQASSRGGSVSIRLQGDRVFLGGHAVTVMKGELYSW